jgi:hypothetical protein
VRGRGRGMFHVARNGLIRDRIVAGSTHLIGETNCSRPFSSPSWTLVKLEEAAFCR